LISKVFMYRPLGIVAGFMLSVTICFAPFATAQNQNLPSIRRVQVLRNRGGVEIEIEASDRVIPQIHEIANPARLVVDFVNVTPGAQLHNQAVNRAEVKNLRVGLFSADPPVTRVVLDLNGPQAYQVFPSGRTVIVKVGGADVQDAALQEPAGPALVNAAYPAQVVPTPNMAAAPAPNPALSPDKPSLDVSFHDGLLSISANRASLSEVLFAVHQRTGAEIAIPAGAEQEKVVGQFGPSPAPEVLAHLLNGSKFNFLIMSSSSDPRTVDQVILSPRAEGPVAQAPRPQPVPPAAEPEDEAAAEQPPPPPPPVRPPPPMPNAAPNANGQTPPAPQGSDVPD
jgi:hypothetical protein